MKTEHVYSTDNTPDHKPTKDKLLLGIFSGVIISIVLGPVICILCIIFWRAIMALDAIDQFFAFLFFFCLPLSLFVYSRFKRIVK